MKTSDIDFRNMSDKLIELFPELKGRHRQETEWLDNDNHYMLYSLVFFKAIEDMLLLEKPDEPLLRRMFDFIELLVNHPDLDIRDVAHHSICVKIANSEVVLQRVQRYLGSKTKDLCADIASDTPGKSR